MKKILLALAIGSVSLLSFNSCTKEEYYDVAPTKTYLFDVVPNDWSRETGSNTYQITLSIPQLTSLIVEEGVVNVAISYDHRADFYEIVPATIENYHFSANYAANPGEVTVYAEDRRLTPIRPEAMRIKVSISEGVVVN
ncbi:hypothetical protein [Sphingobacterium lumbrici]|uniref:hypothetical protein n=1 Tax=Sphingobacterium lumbrici TaxID=2559600 RepID=UPI00112CED14|nr:hypothetical protein [Sphingobacterium lumbrici]